MPRIGKILISLVIIVAAFLWMFLRTSAWTEMYADVPSQTRYYLSDAGVSSSDEIAVNQAFRDKFDDVFVFQAFDRKMYFPDSQVWHQPQLWGWSPKFHAFVRESENCLFVAVYASVVPGLVPTEKELIDVIESISEDLGNYDLNALAQTRDNCR